MPLLQFKPIFRCREFHDIDLTLNWNGHDSYGFNKNIIREAHLLY